MREYRRLMGKFIIMKLIFGMKCENNTKTSKFYTFSDKFHENVAIFS